MRLKIFKLITGTFLLINIFLAYAAPALAQSAIPQTGVDASGKGYDYSKAGVSDTIKLFLCAPTEPGTVSTNNTGGTAATTGNTAANDLNECINKLYKFSIAIASVIAVFFIVIGGYIYMNAGGNQESVDKAKNILETSITALVILFGAYILLRGINPDLIKIPSVQPPTVQYAAGPLTSSDFGTTPTATGGGIPGGTVTGNAAQIANQIASNPNIILATAHSSGITDNANTKQNIVDTAAGKMATRSNYQGAPGGNIYLNTNMLKALASIGSQYKISVSEIAGGSHPEENKNPNSPNGHYGGNAFDITSFDGSRLTTGSPNIQKLMDLCKSLGAGQVIDEVASANHVHCGAFPASTATETSSSTSGAVACQASTTFNCNEPTTCSQYDQYTAQYGVGISNGAQLLKTIMYHESRCKTNLTSSADAFGLMQMKISTANTFKAKCNISESIDGAWFKNNPEKSICLAAEYLKYLAPTCGKDAPTLLTGYANGNCSTQTCPKPISEMMACLNSQVSGATPPITPQTPSILSFINPWTGQDPYPTTDWGNADPNIDPQIKFKLNELQNAFNSFNQSWRQEGHTALAANQVYRPDSYQQHYRSVWEIHAIINNKDNTVGYQCDQVAHLGVASVKQAYAAATALDKQKLEKEFNDHEVKGPVPAGCISDHKSGIAMDLKNPPTGSLYQQLINEMQNFGLCHNIPGDYPHIALKKYLENGVSCSTP